MVWKSKRGGLISLCLTLSSLPSPPPYSVPSPSFFSPLDSGMEETIYLHSLLSHSSILSFSFFCTFLSPFLPYHLPPLIGYCTSIVLLIPYSLHPLPLPSYLQTPSSSLLSLFNFTRSSVSQCLFSYPFLSLFPSMQFCPPFSPLSFALHYSSIL